MTISLIQTSIATVESINCVAIISSGGGIAEVPSRPAEVRRTIAMESYNESSGLKEAYLKKIEDF